MLSYLPRRILASVVTLAGVVLLVFLVARLAGDPAALYVPLDSPQEVREEFSARHGLDQPTHVQLVDYLQGVVQLDFGDSLRLRRPALDVALSRYPTTLLLGFLGIGTASILAVIAGSIAAYRPMSRIDRLTSFGSLTSASIPDFWLALMLMFGISVMLGLLPTSGTGGWQYWVLPVLTVMARPFGLLAQIVRGAMIEALNSPYVATGRSKGLNEMRIVLVHALRNAALPVVTVAGDLAISVINGAVIVESIFGLPGIGRLLIQSIFGRDFAVIQAVVIVTGAAIITLNLLIDVIYRLANPRVRVSGGGD